MAHTRRSREISIFNFSFLDILACTVGALAFILVMVVVINIESLPADLVFRLEQMGEDLQTMNAEVKQWQIEREDYVLNQERVQVLEQRNRELEEANRAARTTLPRLEQELAVAQDLVDALSEGQEEDDALRRQNEDLTAQLAEAKAQVATLEEQVIEQQAARGAEPREAPLAAEVPEWWKRVPRWFWAVILTFFVWGFLLTVLIIYAAYRDRNYDVRVVRTPKKR